MSRARRRDRPRRACAQCVIVATAAATGRQDPRPEVYLCGRGGAVAQIRHHPGTAVGYAPPWPAYRWMTTTTHATCNTVLRVFTRVCVARTCRWRGVARDGARASSQSERRGTPLRFRTCANRHVTSQSGICAGMTLSVQGAKASLRGQCHLPYLTYIKSRCPPPGSARTILADPLSVGPVDISCLVRLMASSSQSPAPSDEPPPEPPTLRLKPQARGNIGAGKQYGICRQGGLRC